MSPFRLTLRDPGGDGPSPSRPGCPTTPCPSRTHPTKSCSVLLTPRRARKTRRVSMVGGSRAQPRAGTEPPRWSGSLPELLTGAASAAPAASAATNRAGRKGSQSPNVCFIWQSQHKSSQIREDLITSPSVSGSWMSVPAPSPELPWARAAPNPRAWDGGDGVVTGTPKPQGDTSLFPWISSLHIAMSKSIIIRISNACVMTSYYKVTCRKNKHLNVDLFMIN